MTPRGSRSTLDEVAKLAKVSRATVSRVVNGSTTVDPKLARRVEAACKELDYVPNQAARSLMTRRTDTIALVAAEPEDRVFGDPFFGSIIRGASQEVAARRRQLTIFMVQGDDELTDVGRYLLGGHCDGMLLISEHGRHRLAADVAAAGIPVVIGGRPLDPSVRVSYVDHNNRSGAELAAAHLRDLGRRRVATITGPLDMSAGLDRLEGFRHGLGDLFDPDLVAHGEFTTRSGAEAMRELLERAPDIDAVFAASDLMALGAISAIQRSGRRVPEDIAVVGYDDIALAAESFPPLTTVHQDTVEQGRRMAAQLLDEIEGERAANGDGHPHTVAGVVLPVELVVRDSA